MATDQERRMVESRGRADLLELYLKLQKDLVVPALLMALCLEQRPDNASV